MRQRDPARLSRDFCAQVKKELTKRVFALATDAHSASPVRNDDPETLVDALQNIIGVAVGEKLSDGSRTGEAAAIVFVQKKFPEDALRRAKVVPEQIGGLPTDVIEVGGVFRALQGPVVADPALRQSRPFPAGVSIGTKFAGSGSLGYRVERGDISEEMILSNYHVLGDLDEPTAAPVIYQPGMESAPPGDDDAIGAYRGGVPIDFGPSAMNKMDAAVATVKPGICVPALREVGAVTSAENPTGGELVRIYGHTSGYSAGTVGQNFTNVVIYYGARPATFYDQLMIQRVPQSRPIAANGDSGSLVIKSPAIACGLLFAGFGDDWAIATPIDRVLKRFRIRLTGTA